MKIFVYVFSLLIPCMMMLLGLYFYKGKLTQPNWVFGYRTSRSMKNQDTWQFANRLMGKYWVYLGSVSIVVVIIFLFFVRNQSEDELSMILLGITFIEMIPMIAPIFFVEKALSNTFDENGKRKDVLG